MGCFMEFEFNYGISELKKRTSKDYLKTINLLSTNNQEYLSLSANDQKILSLLDRAGKVFDVVYLEQDNKYNLEFLNFLNSEIKKGNQKAKLTKVLFDAQKGMFSPDYEGNEIKLVKGIEQPIGLNFYPDDLEVSVFHKIIEKMLDEKKFAEVKNILSQRTMVRWQGEYLIGIDYVDYFKKEFSIVADYLLQASKLCDKSEKKFSKFLKLQAKALLFPNPKLDAKADVVWAKLVDSKFEFTITRESYDDKLTATIFENENLLSRLKKYNIIPLSKDCLGARVGIVNKSGTQLLFDLKDLNKISQEYMPFKEKYTTLKMSNISAKQTAVDVDLVNLYGNAGEFRAGIVLAQNLPNDDKLSLKLGGGRRNVYHRQIRLSGNNSLVKKLLSKDIAKYYSKEATHLATICHENTHSLGPQSYTLGKYSSIMEEFKADMGIYAFLKEFEKNGVFSEEQTKQIIVSELIDSFLKSKPNLSQAHRVRTVMILNRFLKEKAIVFDSKQKINIDFDKVIELSKTMLSEVVGLQLSASIIEAEKYINKYFKWTKEMQSVAQIKKTHSKYLNGKLTASLSKHLNEKFKIKNV